MTHPRVALMIALALMSAACAGEDDYEPGQQLHGLDAIGAAGDAGVTVGAASPDLLTAPSPFQRDPKEKRRLQTVEGRLIDDHGNPLTSASIAVRAAPRYTLTPDKLPAKTLTPAPDGTFKLDMSKSDFLCVDFTAPGVQPLRRWFVALYPKNVRSLPRSQSVTFISPDYPVSKMVPLPLPRQ